MTLAKDLLGVAEHLASRERLKPKQASLRRSVSTSYYALFHLLTAESIALVGARLYLPAQRKVQRWFDHGEMKKVCGMFSTPTAPKQIAAILGAEVSNDLQTVSRVFVKLQEARHDADYNLDTHWSRVFTQYLVLLAEEAFAAWAKIRHDHEASVFALALLSSKLFDRER